MVAQGVLPFESVPETSKTTLAGLAGLPVYLDLAAVTSAASSGEPGHRSTAPRPHEDPGAGASSALRGGIAFGAVPMPIFERFYLVIRAGGPMWRMSSRPSVRARRPYPVRRHVDDFSGSDARWGRSAGRSRA